MVSMYSLAMMKSLRAREKESRIRKRMNQTSRFFPGCKGKSYMKLCTVEIILVISLRLDWLLLTGKIADIIEIEMFQLPVPSTTLGIHRSGQKTLPGAGKLVQDSNILSGPNLNGIHGEPGGKH